MYFTQHVRRVGAAVLLAVLSIGLVAVLGVGPALAGRGPRTAVVASVETPLGNLGERGAGGNVGIIFTLRDPARRKTDVEVQYGVDRNGDGRISDDEFEPATEDRFDPHDTRSDRAPQVFTTSGGELGTAQQFVWKSPSDLDSARIPTTEYALTHEGREVLDDSGSPRFATGPGGTPIFAGVQVRLRAFRLVKGRQVSSPWVYSKAFAVDNNNPPSMTIDTVDANGQPGPVSSDEHVAIHWTVSDPDSEDKNGNGVLDEADGEDENHNGVLDCERIGVAFDYHRVATNEDPASMTPDELGKLAWLPATRVKGEGDTDSLETTPGVEIPTSGDLAGVCSAKPTAPGGGRHWTFVWDTVTDVGTVHAQFVFRARAVDEKREHSAYAFFKNPVQVDNTKVFNPGSPAFPIATLGSPRVGHTVTHEYAQIDVTDPADRGEPGGALGFQYVVVAGGATSLGGGGVSDLDVMSINTISAETSTVSRVPYHLKTARAFHTATALDDGRILFVGGVDASGAVALNTTEVWDPKTRTSEAGPTINVARHHHAAVKLTGGRVVIFGGIAGGSVLNSCELIQVRTAVDRDGNAVPASAWAATTVLPPMATAQHSLHAVLLPDLKVLVTGGLSDVAGTTAVTTAQLFDPIDDINTETVEGPRFVPTVNSMLTARRFASATPLIDGNVLFAGGAASSGAALNTMEVFNWKTRAFEAMDAPAGNLITMGVARAQHTAVLLGDGSVLLAGGTSGNPTDASPALVAHAGVFRLGARSAAGTWSGLFQPVNGDEAMPRRDAPAAAIDNGRVLIAGGITAAGPTAALETYTPAGGVNLPPAARTQLEVNEVSWAYGAPVTYRLTDPELDHARVDVQYIDRSPTGEATWRACTPRPDTVGGEIAESTADLPTTVSDDLDVPINATEHNTPGDHEFIWAVSADIARPLPGTNVGPFNMRVLPYGAVRGSFNSSSATQILGDTKIVPTILPFENIALNRPDNGSTGNGGVPTNNLPAGTLTVNQGGDIRLWVHLRDLDAGGAGKQGSPANCLFEYARDLNGDGLIRTEDNELWKRMTPKGEPVGHGASANPQAGLTTYFNAASDSHPAFGVRPSAEGWTSFDWDSVFDLGAPFTTDTKVYVRVTPTEHVDDGVHPPFDIQGIVRVVRNIPGQAPHLRLIRHPDALYLASYQPRNSAAHSKTAMATNDILDFFFNGQVEPSSFSQDSVQIYRGTTTASRVKGMLTLTNDAGSNTSKISFFPDVQSTLDNSPVYAQNAALTLFFPNEDYSIRIAGHTPGLNPLSENLDIGTMLRPLGQTVAGGQYSTYRLVKNFQEDGFTDPNFRIHTGAANVYADNGQDVANTLQNPVQGSTIVKNAGQPGTNGVSFSFNQAIDYKSLVQVGVNATVLVQLKTPTSGGTRVTQPVVPGTWTITNTQQIVGDTIQTTGTMSFKPVIRMPPNASVLFSWTNGLRAVNGRPLAAATYEYVVETYPRVAGTIAETFATEANEDAALTTASWGLDPCAEGALTGGAKGVNLGVPQGGTDLFVDVGQSVTIPPAGATTADYKTITVARGGTLIIAPTVPGSATIRATGDIVINGTVTFKGANGTNGMHGGGLASTNWYQIYGPKSPGIRLGGVGTAGGGSGGDSKNVLQAYRFAGSAGLDGVNAPRSGGAGGAIGTESGTSTAARYYYGAGGGAGGGNGTAGFPGGRATGLFGPPANGYGAAAAPGAAAGDAIFSTGISGGGGGGGGATGFAPSTNAYYEGGAGGAGAGAVSFITNGKFILGVNGLVDGRGGNGGYGTHWVGAGGGGAGGSLRVVGFGGTVLDGVIDLRGGWGGPHGWASDDPNSSPAADRPMRAGGDGGLGRLVVYSPAFSQAFDEWRVYGQVFVRKVASIPTPSLSGASTPPAALNGSVTTTTVNLGSASEVRYSTLKVAAGAVVDLFGTKALKVFVDGPVAINGTLRVNGVSANPVFPHVFNPMNRARYPKGGDSTTTPLTVIPPGMDGNLGGGSGGFGHTNGTYAFGHEASDGSSPAGSTTNYAGGRHLMRTSQVGPQYTDTGMGYNTFGGTVFYSGDSGGTGGANATDGGDSWACYAFSDWYNYLGARRGAGDPTGAGTTSQSGAAVPANPRRLGFNLAAPDPETMNLSNFASFAGSGGAGGNAGGSYYTGSGPTNFMALGGAGGGGGGALAIVTGYSSSAGSGSLTVGTTATIESRGGAGATPGHPRTGTTAWARAGGGGGSGGLIYLIGRDVTIAPVTTAASPQNGATFDLRGGRGGGRRGTDPSPGLEGYQEYHSTGAFGGEGGFGRLVVDYTNTLNGAAAKVWANRWGLETANPTGSGTASYPSSTWGDDGTRNLWKPLAASARFMCPGILPSGTVAVSRWYDLGSISPIVSSATMGSVLNATATLSVQGAQSHPVTGALDLDNASAGPLGGGQFFAAAGTPVLSGWRWFRYRLDLVRTTPPDTGGAAQVDDIRVDYMTD